MKHFTLPDVAKETREANLRMLKEAMMASDPQDVIALSVVYFDAHPDVDHEKLTELAHQLARQADAIERRNRA